MAIPKSSRKKTKITIGDKFRILEMIEKNKNKLFIMNFTK